MNTSTKGIRLAAAIFLTFASLASHAQTRKEMKFNVGPGSSLTITNDFGPVTVHVSPGSEILANATLNTDQMEVDQTHNGPRVELFTHSVQPRAAAPSRVVFDVTVPADCDVNIHSSAGPITVEKLHGDVSADGDLADMNIHDVGGGHVHLRTLKGNITVTNVADGHVEISSVSGPVTLKNVSGPHVEVNTTNGVIAYTGMFSDNGDYEFTTHSGDINVNLPANASVDVAARSVIGKVENDFPFHPKQHVPFPVTSGRA